MGTTSKRIDDQEWGELSVRKRWVHFRAAELAADTCVTAKRCKSDIQASHTLRIGSERV